MTAHPKIDSITREVFAFRYNTSYPFLTFFKINPQGKKGPDLHIFSIKKITCIHDFALTERFIVFQDIQIVVSPSEMMMKGGSPVVYDGNKTPRIGILPRGAEDETEVTWIDTPGVNMMHLVNAWEEDGGDTVVVVALNFVSIEDGLDSMNSHRSIFEKIRVDIRAKKVVSRQRLCDNNLEFGVINRVTPARRTTCMAEFTKATGVMKMDVSADGDGFTVGAGCYGGEPCFVPWEGAAEEDDGYLVTYMHDEKKEESWFLVMDAKSRSLDICCPEDCPMASMDYFFH